MKMRVFAVCHRGSCLSRYCRETFTRTYATQVDLQSEYVEKPNYPPILPDTTETMKAKNIWHRKITNLETYEQKMMELNMPKAYGFWSCLLNDRDYHANGLPFLKFVTRTSVTEGLPEHYYRGVSKLAVMAAERLAPLVEQLIQLHFIHSTNRSEEQEKQALTSFLSALDRILSSCLPRPTQAKAAVAPLVCAWWLAGGLHSVGVERRDWRHLSHEERHKKLWVRNLWLDREEPYMGDVCISSQCSPLLVVREKRALPPVENKIPSSAAEETSLVSQAFAEGDEQQLVASDGKKQGKTAGDEVEVYPDDDKLDPEVYDYEFDHVPARLVPGYSPGESRPNARLFYHDLTSVDAAASPYLRGGDDGAGDSHPDWRTALLQKLVITSHTQGLAHAGVLGFGPVSELTYPLVQQSAVTDGKRWVLALHQLNTTALHSDRTAHHVNPTVNRLWVSAKTQLWDSLCLDTGSVQGLNKDLLAQIVSCYMRETRRGALDTPYLAPYKYLWNYPAIPYYRRLFREKVEKLLAGDLWVRMKPQLFAWEKIYKLDHNMMPQLNNSKRFYEGHAFRLLPQDRTITQVNPRYIRVCDRPLGKKDPLKREPMVKPETLFTTRYKPFKNWRYDRRYARPVA